MVCVLHISSDFPDEFDADKTHAIKNLVASTNDISHYIFSLNRTSKLSDESMSYDGLRQFSIKYFGLPYGLFHGFSLGRLSKKLHKLIQARNIRPDIIHCHKMTFEGIVGMRLSSKLGIPYVCSVRGDTDLKLIKYKPSYRLLFKRVLDRAERVFFISPWTLRLLSRRYGDSLDSKAVILPNIVGLEFKSDIPEIRLSDRFVCVCHLKAYRRKNLIRIIRAVDVCITEGQDIYLDIIGGGPDQVVNKIRTEIKKTSNPERFGLLGPRTRDEIEGLLSDYAGLILPSYPETFGMVYLEALQAGIPFIHSKNAGVDGYFDDRDISIAVEARSETAIRNAISTLMIKQKTYKENVRNCLQSDCLKPFTTPEIKHLYSSSIKGVAR